MGVGAVGYDATARTWSATGAMLNLPAMAIVAAISALLVIGIQESARFNVVIVAIKLAVIFTFIICAAQW